MHRKVLETHDRDLAERLSGLEVEWSLVPRYAKHITLRATPWTLEQLDKCYDVCKAALWFSPTTGQSFILFPVSQPKDWGIRMNKKERRLALATAFQSATANTVIVEDLKVSLLLHANLQSFTVEFALCVAAITDLHCLHTVKSPAANTS